ncbi:MAG: hypothetical protein CMB80_01390 [Flammeovirgaceae bacterium]|nr:hypothetical protein [Flammeovirgaceae bacterium]
MSTQITTAFVKQYSANVQLLVQQMGSRLRGAVTAEGGKIGEEVHMDRLSATAAQKVTSRHADSPLISTPHDRRRVTPVDYDWGDMIDNPDRLRTLIDPASAYAVNAAMAMGRSMDEEIIGALKGSAYGSTGDSATSGSASSSSIALPAAQKITSATNTYPVDGETAGNAQPLLVGKLIHARKLLAAQDADDYDIRGMGNLFLVVNSAQLAHLLTSTKVNSADFNQIRALVAGDLNQFMGFNIIRTEKIPSSSGTESYSGTTEVPQVGGVDEHYCYAFHRRGVGLCLWEDIVARISERPDKRFSQYIYYRMTLGATRLEEERVVQIQCKDIAKS